MDHVFGLAQERRRRLEFQLTSTFTNLCYYGAPAYARKKDIWPPLASEVGLETTSDFNPEWYHARNREADFSCGQTNATMHQNLPPQVPPNSDHPYESLQGDKLIRLLGLEAGKREDPLKFHFYHVDLSKSHVKYEALSYVWGQKVYTRVDGEYRPYKAFARLNGHLLEIGANLEQALLALRLEEGTRIIWVDAICINQADNEERGHQVGLMSSIYKNAARTIVWLDEQKCNRFSLEEESSKGVDSRGELAFGAICEIVNSWLGEGPSGCRASYRLLPESGETETVEASGFACPLGKVPKKRAKASNFTNNWQTQQDLDRKEAEPEMIQDLGLHAEEQYAPLSPFWQSIGELFECTWFWRLWVFQEIVLARAAILKLGRAEISWQWVGLAAAILRTSYHGICESMNLGGAYNAYLMFRTSQQSDLTPIKFNFLQLLRLTRQYEVSDPRDRIYGLLGITTHDNDPDGGRLLVRPDYSITAGELWNRMAMNFLTDSNDLSLLTCVQYQTEKLESETLHYEPEIRFGLMFERGSEKVMVPSWVPQWTHVFRTTISPWDSAERFSAARGLPRNFARPPSLDGLVIQGIEVGIIGHGLPYMWHAADLSILQSKHLRPFLSRETGLTLLARTLTAGRNSYGSIVQQDSNLVADMAAFVCSWTSENEQANDRNLHWGSRHSSFIPKFKAERWGDSSKVDPLDIEHLAVGGSASRFAETARRFCERRRLFLTLSGHIGLGSDTLQEGDRLCILSGGDMPFILRPLKRGSSSMRKRKAPGSLEDTWKLDSSRYLLVGECYVEGLMHGEVVTQLAAGEPLVGPISPDLVLKTILEEAGNQIRKIGWVSDPAAQQEQDRVQAIIKEKREELETIELKKLQKSWFHIV